jgi:hypothetical protein
VSTFDVTLLTSIVERHEQSTSPGIASVVRVSLSGEPHAAAIVDAVIADYHLVTGRPPVTDQQLANLVDQKVTVLRVTTSMLGSRAIVACPGTIFRGSALGLLPKGKRRQGYRLSADTVLDIEPGYTGVEHLAGRVAAVRARLPNLVELTRDRLAQLPTNGRDCSLAVFGTWRLPHRSSAGAIWLLHSYLPAGDIAQGLLLVRSADGVSENGSVLGEQLRLVGGEVVGAPVVPLREALALVDEEYPAVLAKLAGRRR